MRLIFPPQEGSPDRSGNADLTRHELAEIYSYPRSDRLWVRANMVTSADGAATIRGRSSGLSGDADRSLFALLRTLCDVILVGAGTVRADDPALTVRSLGAQDPSKPGVQDPSKPGVQDPLRVVLGRPPEDARVHPALTHVGEIEPLLDDLGSRGVLQLLVEGGARVAASFHRKGLVNHYVLYFAPAFMGGDDGLPLFAGPGSRSMEGIWRGRIVAVTRFGPDVRIDVVAGQGGLAVP